MKLVKKLTLLSVNSCSAVNCSGLSFTLIYSQVKAYQDVYTGYESLQLHCTSAQLNCQMDYHAKEAIWYTGHNPDAPNRRFP